MSKIIMAWPPIMGNKGFITAGQNRQVQFLKDPFFAYPIIPATAATMLVAERQEVLWLDAIAEQMDDVDFGRILIQMHPEFIVFEASTPLINRYYEIINGIKQNIPDIKIILCGEHVTALPEEAKAKCTADYIIQGGKWYYEVFKTITGKDWPKEKLIPHIHRDITRWWLYAYNNGNYKYIPATYIMSAQDCWYRGCKFCSWASYHKDYLVRPVEDVLLEIERLIEAGYKEIFDDSGTFPVGDWLKTFCQEMIDRGYNKHISISCNMRFGALKLEDMQLMAKAGFRMILWGLESVNQTTLDMLNKGYNIKSITEDLILAKQVGLQSHLTVMFGYPWETYSEARRTYKMVRWLLLKDYAFSAQATICIPYPGTPLWQYCKENNLLNSENWDDYDMTKPIMKITYPEKKLFDFQKGIYNIAFHPKFIWNKFRSIKEIGDLKYYLRIGKKVYDRFGNFYEIGKATID